MNTYEIPPAPPGPTEELIIKFKEPGEKKYSLWDLQQLITFTKEKIQSAHHIGVKIDTQIQNISYTIAESPSLRDSNTNEIVEVALNRLIIVIGIYCNQIICEITKNHIIKLYNEGINRPELQKKHGMIKLCMEWALRQLPEEFSMQSPFEIDFRTRKLLAKVEEMKNKILQKG